MSFKMLKFIFGRGVLHPWAPQRGVAPAPHQGLGGPWTPAWFQWFFFLKQFPCLKNKMEHLGGGGGVVSLFVFWGSVSDWLGWSWNCYFHWISCVVVVVLLVARFDLLFLPWPDQQLCARCKIPVVYFVIHVTNMWVLVIIHVCQSVFSYLFFYVSLMNVEAFKVLGCEYLSPSLLAKMISCLMLMDLIKSYQRITCVISRVPDQNGISRLYSMLEIHHSGREPLILYLFMMQCLFIFIKMNYSFES